MPRFEIRGEKGYYYDCADLIEEITVIDNETNKVIEDEYLYVAPCIELNEEGPIHYLQLADDPTCDLFSSQECANYGNDRIVVCEIHETIPTQPNIVGHGLKELYSIEEVEGSSIITQERAYLFAGISTTNR